MAISIPTVVGDYIDAVIAALSQGSELNVPPLSAGSGTIHAAAQNYLRAQDAATILDLLQGLLSQSSVLTVAANSTTTTIIDGAGSFVPRSYEGAYVTFDAATTTAALRGVTRRVTKNDDRTLTFAEAWPTAPQAGDEYTIAGGQVEEYITAIRDGAGASGQPAGNPYGDRRTVLAGFQKLVNILGLTQATATVDGSGGDFGDGETLTVGNKTYTFQATLTNVDGNIHIGASADDTLTNLANAINDSGGTPGTDYATANTIHTQVSAGSVVADVLTLTVRASEYAGAGGNQLPISTDAVNVVVSGSTFSGGDTSDVPARSNDRLVVHPAGQPGDNAYFAAVVDAARDAVAAFTLPT